MFWPAGWRLRSYIRKLLEYGRFKLDWRLAKSRLSAMVAVSDAVLDAWHPLVRSISRRDNIDQRVIYWGVDADEFRAPDPDTAQRVRDEMLGPLNSQGPLILVVSRLHAGKNIIAVLQAMQTTLAGRPDAVLCVAGDGPERDSLADMAQKLGVAENIRWLGQRKDVPLLLAAADLVVFPSVVEGFGMVALEALAAGTSVVCFDLPSLRALRADVDAIYVAAGTDPADLGREIMHALADPARHRRGQDARKIVLNSWSLDRTAEAYDALYRHILAARQN
jgi:glycosyltransferase involved in cell wall biosynthesis